MIGFKSANQNQLLKLRKLVVKLIIKLHSEKARIGIKETLPSVELPIQRIDKPLELLIPLEELNFVPGVIGQELQTGRG